MFDAPKQDEFTQGTVFSCAYAEEYADAAVYGLVVTARCDAAQDKTPIFSYIPVVSLTDWILNEGAKIAMERISSDCQNGMRNHLKALNLSESLLSTKTVDEIYLTHFLPKEGERQHKDRCQKMKFLVDSYKENERLRAGEFIRDEILKHLAANQSKIDSIIKELSGHRIFGYYLLRSLPQLDGSTGDQVALLREIHHIPRNLARQIVAGLSKSEWEIYSNELQRCPRFSGADDCAVPVAKLKSPWIEHLMQNFTLLFARIGVTDNDFSSVKKSLSGIGLG